jgi:hypothetical protein
MELNPFVATLVNPGEPLTAQAWNDLVTAIDDTHKFLLATTHTLAVRITNTGLDPATVRVTASRSDAPPIEGVRPFGGGAVHTLSELELGAYTIRASAPGFQDATATVTVADAPLPELSLALLVAQPLMPDLFGVQLAAAIATLQQLGATIARVLDFNGNDVPPASPTPEASQAPVLVQHPPAGVPVIGGVGLVVAIAPRIESAVPMPSLAGLTEVEARRALEQAGLVVGRVRTLSSAE